MKHKLLISAVVFGLVACGPSNKDSGFDQESSNDIPARAELPLDQSDTITIIAQGANMAEMKYDTKSIRVPANKKITIALVNESTDATMPHNIVFIQKGTANDVGQAGIQHKDNGYVNPNEKNVIAHSAVAPVGETVYLTFTTPTPGDYEFICSYPGHWGLMKGKFLTR